MKSLARAMLCGYVVLVALGQSPLPAKNAASSFALRQLDEEHGKVQVFDVDKDGYNDVMKIQSQGESLAWYQYGPGGAFTKHVVFKDRRFRADRLAVADLDGDGDLDVVTGLEEDGPRVVIWLENPLVVTPSGVPTQEGRGTGDGPRGIVTPPSPSDPPASPRKDALAGTLQTGQATQPGAWKIHKVGPQSDYIKDIGIADFNRDGKLDIVTRTHTETAIFFQRSPTQWSAPKLLKHESHEGMDVADLDRDGDPDLVLNGFWFETPEDAEGGTYKKHVFDAKWFTPVDKSWRDNNAAIKVADVNGDNLPDIIISHSELPGYPISIYTAASIEDVRHDRWREIRVIDRFDFCQTLDAGDVDNDGDIDILAAKFERAPNEGKQWRNEPPFPVVVFRNVDGQGTAWAQEVLSQDGLYAGVFGDIGSDGDLDIVGPRTYWAGPLRIWENKRSDRPLTLEEFTYIQVDDSRDKRYFGLAFGDFTGDGYVDIVAGKWFYRNPGGDMTGKWERAAIDEHVDALAALDVDGDAFGDFIGLACDEQYWYEARDMQGREWSKVRIGSLPICNHKLSTQYYRVGQIVPGGRPEIVLGQYYLQVPADPQKGEWPAVRYTAEGQGYAIGDIDGDGLLDIAGSYRIPGEDKVPGASGITWWCSRMCWWKNPGDDTGNWQRFDLGTSTNADRFELADLNGDGRLDLVTSEERYPGHVANASCYWFEQPADPKSEWRRHLVVTQWSMNNLDVADMDGDGDMDIVLCEHSMPLGKTPAPGGERLQIWVNDGKGNFTEKVIDRGKESHLGARVVDLDRDGDLDIVSIAWRDYQYLHLWRNDAKRSGQDGTR